MSVVVDRDKLAAQLLECASLVQHGEHSPLIRQTLHDLADYLKAVSPRNKTVTTTTTTTTTTKPTAGVQHNNDASASSPPKPNSSRSQESLTNRPPSKPSHFGQVLGKMIGIDLSTEQPGAAPSRSEASKQATSQKNAARLKAELGGASTTTTTTNTSSTSTSSHTAVQASTHHQGWFSHHGEEAEWCDEHFTMGCACKTRRAPTMSGTASVSATTTAKPPATAAAVGSSSNTTRSKPPFQRPTNPQSNLIANGWIEQQRRSKMRTVWKEVLASLVEGRNGQETTLWIQREVFNATSGKHELEALHQIPIKWLEQIHFMGYSTDNRFSLKVFHNSEEFVFRCATDDAAQNWVLTLRSIQQIVKRDAAAATTTTTTTTGVDDWDKKPVESKSFEEEKKASDTVIPEEAPPPPSNVSHRMSVKEMRAIAHGMGISTIGMERSQLEAIVARIAAGVPPSSSNMTAQASAPYAVPAAATAAAAASVPPARTNVSPVPPVETAFSDAKSVAAAAELGKPTGTDGAEQRRKALEEQRKQQVEEQRRREQQDEMERRQKLEEVRKRQVEEEAAKRQAAERGEEAERQRLVAQRVHEQQEMERRKREEEERQRLLSQRVHGQQDAEKRKRDEEERRRLEQERLKRDEEEIRRRVAEKQAEQQKMKQEEAQRMQQQAWQQQQQAWQKQQAEEEQRRRMAEMQAAEARRQQEEAYRRQQQWHQQQQTQQPQRPPGAPPFPQQGYPPPPPPPHSGGYQQPPPQGHGPHPGFAAAPNSFPGAAPPPHPNQQPSSTINMKYAKMAQQAEGGNSIMVIKHGLLIHWALMPPMLQVLRPIEDLITSIHTVFPPIFGVPGHEYFTRWTAVNYDEISHGRSMGNRPDDAKLKKVMRKLRFFLHPDKLPKDLSTEQTFMCKMLWDVVSDAEAEHKKKEEELGWIRS